MFNFQQNKDTARQPVITANSHRKPSMYVLLLYYPGEQQIFPFIHRFSAVWCGKEFILGLAWECNKTSILSHAKQFFICGHKCHFGPPLATLLIMYVNIKMFIKEFESRQSTGRRWLALLLKILIILTTFDSGNTML